MKIVLSQEDLVGILKQYLESEGQISVEVKPEAIKWQLFQGDDYIHAGSSKLNTGEIEIRAEVNI